MKVVLLGATGMVGSGVLRECLLTTEEVGKAMLAVARRGGGRGVLESADIDAASAGKRTG